MYRAPLKDLQFVLEKQLHATQLAATSRFSDYSGELAESILREADRFASGVLEPLNQTMQAMLPALDGPSAQKAMVGSGNVLLGLAAGWAVRASLPRLDGAIRLSDLAAPLAIHRDALGTAVLQGTHRADLARGLGFLHAQERFFEMDLTRRSAAGGSAPLTTGFAPHKA